MSPMHIPDFFAEFAATAPERAALPAAELLVINIDVNAAVATASRAEASLLALRDQVAKLSIVDMREYDKISAYARALAWSQANYAAASDPPGDFFVIIERASKLREMLLASVKALIVRGVIDRRPLDSLKGGSGYSSLGTDLSTLAGALRAHPQDIAATTMLLVEEAQVLSEEIIWAAPKRSSTPTTVDAASDERQRAFTLFVRAYDEARRAVSFLRWHQGDVDILVPSLYAGRGGRGSKADDVEEPVDPEAETPPAASLPPATGTPDGPPST